LTTSRKEAREPLGPAGGRKKERGKGGESKPLLLQLLSYPREKRTGTTIAGRTHEKRKSQPDGRFFPILLSADLAKDERSRPERKERRGEKKRQTHLMGYLLFRKKEKVEITIAPGKKGKKEKVLFSLHIEMAGKKKKFREGPRGRRAKEKEKFGDSLE